jgi:hypothetical protein
LTTSAPSHARASRGWLEAVAFVFAIGALSLVYAIGYARGAHPIAFILYAMLASSTATLALTRPGVRHALAIMRHPSSWLVGASIVLIEVFYYVTLTYVSPAHGNLILRIGVPIAMLTGWTLYDRRPPVLATVGGIGLAAAVAFVVFATAPDVRWPMALTGTLTAAWMVVRGFASEFNPSNRAAKTTRDKLRFTGVVVLITALLGFGLAALAAAAMAIGVLPQLRVVPSAAQMLHAPTILIGAIAGGSVVTLMMYLNFSAVVKITTENFTAMMALSPFTAWAFQELGAALGLITVTRPEPQLIAAMFACAACVLLIVVAGHNAQRARITSSAGSPGSA